MSVVLAARFAAISAAAVFAFSAVMGLKTAPTLGLAASAAGRVATQTNAAQLSELAWLEGRWRGNWGPRIAEQTWTSPQAGLIMGDFRVTEDDKTLLIELFTLIQKPQGIELRFRHFTPELVPWEKSSPALLSLEMTDGRKFVFVNHANGQPKRSIITRIEQDTYTLRSEIVTTSGELEVVEITFHREPAPGEKPRRHR